MSKTDWAIALALVVLSVVVFANGLHGDFIYDDVKQIQQNRLIQDGSLFWKALTSDVWAFKGEKGESWSNYWRPTFVAYLMIKYRLFGIESTFGWHLMNLLLHAGVVVLAYGLLRQLRLTPAVAGWTSALFAVHPVHVESVTWISGSPDLLMAVGVLGALWCVLSAQANPRPWKWATAMGLFLFAQLAKESGVLFPALVFVAIFLTHGEFTPRIRVRRAFRAAAPFAVFAAIYLVLHQIIAAPRETPWDPGMGGVVLSMPQLLAFYLRQAFFPLWIGPNYPLRVVSPENIGLINFVLPLFVVGGIAWLTRRMIRSRPVAQLGGSMFLLLLAPALYVRVFRQEEIVHDRYLYLPLLGLLIAVVPWVVARLDHLAKPDQKRYALGTVAALAVGLLSLQTVLYNPVWTSSRALWERAVATDPTSSFAWAELAGINYREARRKSGDEKKRALAEARRCVDRAIELYPVTRGYLLRGQIARDEGRPADAIPDFQRILEVHPDHVLASESLATCYQALRQPGEALRVLQVARENVPHRHCVWTDKIAICLYQLGRKSELIDELESVRDRVAQEYRLVPHASLVLYRLAVIYTEQPDVDQARAAFDEFLSLTSDTEDPVVKRLRAEAATRRANLP